VIGGPRVCELCGRRPATVRPRRSGVAAPHGWVCVPCLLTTKIVGRACPPRRTEDPTALDDRSSERLREAWRLESRARGAAETARGLAEATGQSWRIADAEARRFGRRVRATYWWLFEIMEPGVFEQIAALKHIAEAELRDSGRARDAARELRQRSIIAARGIVDLDNPFEDPDFIERLIEGRET
jgi:hypothetical protein